MAASKRNKKFLYIKIKSNLHEAITEYCADTGLDPQDVGFHIGFISAQGKDESTAHSVAVLNSIFFYAGMLHAIKHKGKYEFGYKDRKLIDKIVKLDKPKPKINAPQDYMG